MVKFKVEKDGNDKVILHGAAHLAHFVAKSQRMVHFYGSPESVDWLQRLISQKYLRGEPGVSAIFEEESFVQDPSGQ